MLYCAAGLKPPVDAIRQNYEKEYGRKVQVQYEGSGTLLSKIRIAPRGDLFLAADESYLKQAMLAGLVRERLSLATMTPVIAIRSDAGTPIHELKDLLKPDVQFSLANPEAAAIGRKTQAILRQLQLWEQLESRARTLKPTVMDLANDVKLGTVDAAVVWDAVVAQYSELKAVDVPQFANATVKVEVGVMQASEDPTGALHFARYLAARDRGLMAFAAHGYAVTQGDVWADRPELVFFSGGVNRLAIQNTLREFELREGVVLNTQFNGCGILVATMKTGQLPDAYFACDVSFITGLAEQFDPIHDLSTTDIVVAVARENPRNIQALSDLAGPGLRVGVTNPQQSALGALTENLLKEMNHWKAISQNIKSQTPTADLLVNQIRTGSLDAVFIYRANVAAVLDDLRVISIDHPRARAIQPYAVMLNSDHKHTMYRLLEAIRSQSSQQRFADGGFQWLDRPATARK